MTPAARLSTAAELMDLIIDGDAAERVLTRWARASRFAGSKDRAAVRDIVFDILRKQRSYGWRMGSDTGRALVIAHLLDQNDAVEQYFTGEGYAPAPLSADELARICNEPERGPYPVELDFPDFLQEPLKRSLGEDFENILLALRDRAPVDLRVNTLKADRNAARDLLARDGIECAVPEECETALRVTENPRLVQNSKAYRNGLVELQDLSSQLVALACDARPGMTVLDYCAGGGGKSLALGAAMKGQGRLLAHDINPGRMKNLPERAGRADLRVELTDTRALPSLAGACDLVLVDAPCSGSGAWRRNPDSKWRLSDDDLDRLIQVQGDILRRAVSCVRPGGRLVYATCSILDVENQIQTARFLSRNPQLSLLKHQSFSPLTGGDGFYFCEIT